MAQVQTAIPKPRRCVHCDGTGRVLEQMDDDRRPVDVSCPVCAGKGTITPKGKPANE